MAEKAAETATCRCLNDDPHEGHLWQSLTHWWWCPGRKITKAERLATWESTGTDVDPE